MINEEIEQLGELKNQLLVWLAERGAAFLVAIVIIVLGFWLSKNLSKLISKLCKKRDIDITLARFFAGFFYGVQSNKNQWSWCRNGRC